MSAASNAGFSAETLIDSSALFNGLDHASLKRLAAGATAANAPKGTLLFKPGDACEGFHIVLTGLVKLALQTADGGENIIELVGGGGTFGEAVALAGEKYPVVAQALTDSTLVYIGRTTLLSEVERAATRWMPERNVTRSSREGTYQPLAQASAPDVCC